MPGGLISIIATIVTPTRWIWIPTLRFPALMTVAIGLQYESMSFLLRNKAKYHAFEWFLMIAHFALYFGFVFYCLPLWQAICFVCIHQILTGLYLGAIFAP